MQLNLIHFLARPSGLLLLGLMAHAGQARTPGAGPWAQATSPFTNTGVSSTNVQTLQITGPSTLWGWARINGTAGASSDNLAVSTNEGQSWQTTTVATKVRTGISTYSGAVVADAWMTDNQNAWVLTQDVETAAITLKKTTTGLAGFSSAPAPAYAAKVRFFTSSTGIIIGNAGNASTWDVYRTTDGGLTWASVSPAPPGL